MPSRGSTIVWTAIALVAFAANSLFCRLALRDQAIDAASFTTIRLLSGAAALLLLTRFARGAPAGVGLRSGQRGSWTSATVMFVYAVPFSFAYTMLAAGTGALVLFGTVQLTMMLAAIRSGEQPHAAQWTGLAMALAGLVYLVLPGLAAPPVAGAALMALAGCAWGIYSLLGRGATDPLAQTTGNFVRAVPLALLVSLVALPRLHLEARGVQLAVASGALASGLGYVVWYTALRGLTATRAAVVQLAVPVLAAAGGVIALGETLSVRLVVSAVLVLGGIALALRARAHESRQLPRVRVAE